jgi:hypothetical protein
MEGVENALKQKATRRRTLQAMTTGAGGLRAGHFAPLEPEIERHPAIDPIVEAATRLRAAVLPGDVPLPAVHLPIGEPAPDGSS